MAVARDVDGAFTAGDSLAEVERNAKESIAVALDLPRGAEATVVVTLEGSVRTPFRGGMLVGNVLDALAA